MAQGCYNRDFTNESPGHDNDKLVMEESEN